MNFSPPDFAPAYPEIFLLVMVCVVLLADLAWGGKKSYLAYSLAQLSLFGCLLITFATSEPGVVYTFSGMFVDDPMADLLKLLVYLTVSAVLVYSREYITERGMLSGEFFSLALFATLGMMVMISASHFLTLYLGLELLSLSQYAMVAMRRESVAATEAAIKFFVLGALASGFLLYGMSMIYGATGSLDIARVVEVIQGGVSNHAVLVVGLVFIVAGISFKLSVAPFHMWVPDVYEGAPTAVALFIGSAPKFAAFGFIMRLLAEGLGGLAGDWQDMLIILAVMSMIIGNFAAIAQTNIKRMLAYSTISHMGFVLLGIIAADGNGYSAAMFYIVVYVLMTLGTFGMIMLLSRAGFEADKLDDFKGLNRRNPWYAFITLLLMFSMAGIPPTVGIYAKLSVLEAVLNAGYVWLAVLAVLLSLVGVFYYLRIVKLMYFDEPETNALIRPQGDVKLLISANGIAILAFGVFPQTLIALCAYAIQQSI
ncbi:MULTISPECIES: NADH-quinone oxidoreductase subunit NuoN [unclassified Nitrosospira]|uniref:NADH-quinone oxidoreductase subunit NuoN n=1 Tax=unclassified Nitrosospira TaxID=2609267 RepID=UPI000D31E2C0|nr:MULTISPECIES: NADH-quinone oxidoreductase subunit NuoN [unclassified Nitrosospira]PTR16685.1 NADH dehydrogenase subunit N [Nitrosospira sp. Nsp2]WON73297.1 NADH-quinone oxidoreductase subunit NuoN [Nitrosospira sp. Is2]